MKTMKKIRKKFGTAIVQNKLIVDGDHILVAVSGGKDSLLLLTLLVESQKRFPINYKITACHLKNELSDPVIREETAEYLESYFKNLNIPYIIRDLPVQSTSDSDKKVGCFWCSWMRRKILFQIAEELNIQKVALGHHKDDVIETFLLNLLHHGKLCTMPVSLDMFNGNLQLIRPLAYVPEDDIIKMVNKMDLQTGTCLCPYAGNTKRDAVKNLIKYMEKDFGHVKTSIFNATFADKIDPTYMN